MKVRKLPVSKSKSEPTFTEEPFGTPEGIRSNNCTAYSYQVQSKTPGFKLQPGELAGKHDDFSLRTCSPATKRVLADLSAKKFGYPAKPGVPCKKGTAKIMLFLDPGSDFHFLRQNGDVVYKVREKGETRASIAAKFRVPPKRVLVSDETKTLRKGQKVRVVGANTWSHKRGLAFGPDLTDARGDIIMDPRLAKLDYGDYNYTKYCASFCIKQKPCPRKKKIPRS